LIIQIIFWRVQVLEKGTCVRVLYTWGHMKVVWESVVELCVQLHLHPSDLGISRR
jgi:hypothetical protein